MTLRGDDLRQATAGLNIVEGHDLSLFAAIGNEPNGFAEKLLVHDQADAATLGTAPAAVLLHERAAAATALPKGFGPLLRPGGILLSDPQDDLLASEQPPRSALIVSKVGGQPAWCQDPVAIPGHEFVLQLTNRVFEMLGPRKYENILGGGIGYLFLQRDARPGKCGHFVVQRT